MKKVAIYIRVSTIEQAKEGFSVGAQRDRLVNYCKAKNWNIQDIYVDDGYTGTNIDRPGLQTLINNLDKIDVVLVYKLDRLSRSQKDVLYLVEEKFLENNVDFVSLLESFDTSTPFGRAMLGILAVFAQLERDTIIERVKLGNEKRAKEGLWHGGGNNPYGYKYDETLGKLVVDEYEAMIVKEIFKKYLEGKGQNRIARELNESGYKTRSNTDWNIRQIGRILKNETYLGILKYKGEIYEGLHDAIISKEIFDEVQKLIESKSKKSTTSKYLLGGLVWCGYCGARLRASWSRAGKHAKKYYNYTCYSVVGAPEHMVKSKDCQNKCWEMSKLDKRVVDELRKLSLNFDRLKKAYEYKLTRNKKSEVNKVDVLEKKIRELDVKINRMMDLYQDDKIPTNIVSERIEKLYKEKVELNKSLEEYKLKQNKSDDIFPFENYLFWLEKFDEIWNEASFEERKIILTSFIDKVIVYKDDVKVIWNK